MPDDARIVDFVFVGAQQTEFEEASELIRWTDTAWDIRWVRSAGDEQRLPSTGRQRVVILGTDVAADSAVHGRIGRNTRLFGVLVWGKDVPDSLRRHFSRCGSLEPADRQPERFRQAVDDLFEGFRIRRTIRRISGVVFRQRRGTQPKGGDAPE